VLSNYPPDEFAVYGCFNEVRSDVLWADSDTKATKVGISDEAILGSNVGDLREFGFR
jgi:hypothetical protein